MFDPWVTRHPLATRLAGAAPGVGLTQELALIDVASADDAALIELVAAWERTISWAASAQAAIIAEIVRRTRSGEEAEFVPDDVAARLGTSRRTGEIKVSLALGLAASPQLQHALATGVIDVRKATVLTDDTAHLPRGDAAAIHARLLPTAAETTAPQLRAAIRRAELELDPQAAEQRHQRARAERHVTLTPAPSSMAWLTAHLPADGALRVMTAVDAVAGVGAPDDPRGLDARRADALVEVMSRVLDTGEGPGGVLPVRQRRRPHVQVTASAATLLGLDEAPAVLAGYGPVPAAMARQIAAGSTWSPLLTDALTGELVARSSTTYRPGSAVAALVVDRDVTCRFPGCRIPAARCDLDHISAFDPSRPASEQTCIENLQALCRRHHRLKTSGRWVPIRDVVSGRTRWQTATGHLYQRDPVRLGPAPGAADGAAVPHANPEEPVPQRRFS